VGDDEREGGQEGEAAEHRPPQEMVRYRRLSYRMRGPRHVCQPAVPPSTGIARSTESPAGALLSFPIRGEDVIVAPLGSHPGKNSGTPGKRPVARVGESRW